MFSQVLVVDARCSIEQVPEAHTACLFNVSTTSKGYPTSISLRAYGGVATARSLELIWLMTRSRESGRAVIQPAPAAEDRRQRHSLARCLAHLHSVGWPRPRHGLSDDPSSCQPCSKITFEVKRAGCERMVMWRFTGARTRLELLMAVVDDFYRGYGHGSARGPGSGRRARASTWRNLHLEGFASKEIISLGLHYLQIERRPHVPRLAIT